MFDYFPGRRLHPNSLRTIVMVLSRPQISREENVRFEQEMPALVMSYAAVFCLTRADKLSAIRGDELCRLRGFATDLGVNLLAADFLNGVIIKYSKGYREISKAVFGELIIECQRNCLVDSEATLRYLENRYRDHQPTSPRSGNLSEPAFNTVHIDNFAVRNDGSIYTYSQQSCHVVVLCGTDGVGLGHWEDFRQLAGSTLDRDVKRLLGGNYDQVYIISDTPEKIAPVFVPTGMRIHIHRKQPDMIYAVKASRTNRGVQNIQAASQGNNFKNFPLGPCKVVPVNHFEELKFDGLS